MIFRMAEPTLLADFEEGGGPLARVIIHPVSNEKTSTTGRWTVSLGRSSLGFVINPDLFRVPFAISPV